MTDLHVGTQPEDLHHFIELIESLGSSTRDEHRLSLRAEEISSWSVGEHLDHVLTADLLNLKAARLLSLGRGKPPSEGLNEAGHRVLTGGVIPLGLAQAPEFVMPKAGRSATQLEELRVKALQGWQKLGPRLDRIDESGQVLHHFAVGELGAKQWLRFALIHTRHHVAIVDRIVAHVGESSG